MSLSPFFSSFFFNATAPTEIYTLSLHDALPISIFLGRLRAGLETPRVDLQHPESRLGWYLPQELGAQFAPEDRKSTRLNSSHITISYAVFCLKKKKQKTTLRSNQKDNSTQKVLI